MPLLDGMKAPEKIVETRRGRYSSQFRLNRRHRRQIQTKDDIEDDLDEIDEASRQDPKLPHFIHNSHGDADPRPLKAWLIKRLMPAVGHGLLSGQWGAGKTWCTILVHGERSRSGWRDVGPCAVLRGELLNPVGVVATSESCIDPRFRQDSRFLASRFS
ncbi:hypothetical protein ACVL5V_003958 [Bradyrhizobium ottawaense]